MESCAVACVLRGAAGCVQELKERHRHVMQAMLMDVLRALATPNMDIRKKTLDIALDLITQHNIDEVRFPLLSRVLLTHAFMLSVCSNSGMPSYRLLGTSASSQVTGKFTGLSEGGIKGYYKSMEDMAAVCWQ